MVDALHLARVRAADAENRAEAVRRLAERRPVAKAPPPAPVPAAHVPPPAPVPAAHVPPPAPVPVPVHFDHPAPPAAHK